MGLGAFSHLLTLEGSTTGELLDNHRYAPLVQVSKPTCSDWKNLPLPCLSLATNLVGLMPMIEGLSPKPSQAVVFEEPLTRGTLLLLQMTGPPKPCFYCTLPRLRLPNSSGYHHAAFPSEIHTKDSLCIPMATPGVASHHVHLCQPHVLFCFGGFLFLCLFVFRWKSIKMIEKLCLAFSLSFTHSKHDALINAKQYVEVRACEKQDVPENRPPSGCREQMCRNEPPISTLPRVHAEEKFICIELRASLRFAAR